ncbi:MAG: hypothetical protein H6Q05_1638 [Acidobacteria bacterium]|nr:hypothetical protein [Acidobacteriota bacterium]
MKCSYLVRLMIVLSLALFMSACASRPTEMIDLTEKARQEATDEHADQFAMEEWSAAEKDWQDASAKLDAEEWGDAYPLLLRAKGHYNRARDLAKGKREAAIKKIDGILQPLKLRLQRDLKDDPAIKRLTGARKADFDAQVKQIEDNILQIGEQLKNAEYSDAENLAGRTLRQVHEVQQEFLKK